MSMPLIAQALGMAKVELRGAKAKRRTIIGVPLVRARQSLHWTRRRRHDEPDHSARMQPNAPASVVFSAASAPSAPSETRLADRVHACTWHPIRNGLARTRVRAPFCSAIQCAPCGSGLSISLKKQRIWTIRAPKQWWGAPAGTFRSVLGRRGNSEPPFLRRRSSAG